jgi:NTP pyrophosphatase (non-canonical NTP hydrolase)
MKRWGSATRNNHHGRRLGMKFRKKPVVIEAITFDELVEYGKTHGANIVNYMPWSFEYQGHPITHEDDDCYLIQTPDATMRFNRGDMLITGVNGEIYPCKLDIFEKTYAAPVENLIISSALYSVIEERLRQDNKWGEQNHDPYTYMAILMEELGEMAQAALQTQFGGKHGGLDHLREEAVQTAAVALAIVECLDRGKWRWANVETTFKGGEE